MTVLVIKHCYEGLSFNVEAWLVPENVIIALPSKINKPERHRFLLEKGCTLLNMDEHSIYN